MLTPVPSRIDDPKDAVLWAVFDKLQKIDENVGSRINFATTIAYNSHLGLTDPVFKCELDQIREILKITPIKNDNAELDNKIRSFEEPDATVTIGRADDI